MKNGEHYLKCNTKHAAENACVGSFITYKLLTRTILDELSKIVSEYLNKNEAEQRISFDNNLDEKRLELKTEAGAYEKKIAEYAKGIKDLYFDKVKGIITDNDFVEFSKDFYREKERFEKLLAEAQTKLDIAGNESAACEAKRSLIEEYTTITDLNREIVEKLIDCIFVGRREKRTEVLLIEIHWSI